MALGESGFVPSSGVSPFPSIAMRIAPATLTAAMVFGERNSGTNNVMELLRRNFPAFADSPADRVGTSGFRYGWKHAFPQMLAAPPSTLAVGVFRNPETWVRSMHKRPWHVGPRLAALPFHEFLRARWFSWVDETNFGIARDDPFMMAELQWDRHPLTGERFANICALRTAKNAGFLSLPRRFGNCILVRHEDVIRDPEHFVQTIHECFGVPRVAGFVPIVSRRGRPSEGPFEPASYPPLTDEDRAFLWSQLDLAQELRLGYGPAAQPPGTTTAPGQRRHLGGQGPASGPASGLTRDVSARLRAMLAQDPSIPSLTAAYRLLAKWRAQLVENTVVRHQGTVVGSGPFAGMDYGVRATEGARVARLLGCYEASLVPIIETIIGRAYDLVIDIGCAEGYYAVGLARRMPKTKVIARDASPAAREACATLARRNGVSDRVEIGGLWEHGDFDICLSARTVVICDIEGAEDSLLDPARAEGLLGADILVEVHDCDSPGLSEAIAGRFSPTHRVTKLHRHLEADALPNWMEDLSDLDRLTALWEWRKGPTPWLWMERIEQG